MRQLVLGLGLAGACAAGCVAPNLDPFAPETDAELARMMNRRATFDAAPWGPYGAPTPEELAATRERTALARADREGAAWWMGVGDPAWTGDPHAMVPGQAQWLTALEAKVIGTQPWEHGAVIAQHLQMDWMRDLERRVAMARDLQEYLRADRAPYGGYATDHSPVPDSVEAEDGFPGYTVHERHAWRIHWGHGLHWWMATERPALVPNVAVPSGPAGHPAEGTPEAPPKKPDAAKPADKPADQQPAEKKPPEKKPAAKPGDDGEF